MAASGGLALAQSEPPGSSVRFGPESYRAGQTITLTNQLAPLADVGMYSLTEYVPAGWSVGAVSDYGNYDAEKHWVRWLFMDNLVRSVTWQLIAPSNASSVLTLNGNASFDGTSVTISGLTAVPLELPSSGALSRHLPSTYRAGQTISVTVSVAPDSQVGLYGLEENIPAGCVPINLGGGTSTPSGTIKWGPFVDGLPRDFSYTLTAPASATTNIVFSGTGWFDSATVPTAGDSAVAAAPLGGGSVTRSLPEQYFSGQSVTVSLLVEPGLGTEVHAVLETPPAGWTVTNISHFGSVSPDGMMVRWGPFGDETSRTFTYDLLPPDSAHSNAVFTGSGLFDGATVATLGQITIPWRSLESGVVTRSLPATCRPGQTVWVTNLVEPNAFVTTYAIEEIVPTNWTVIDAGLGTYLPESHTVRWGPIFDNATNTLLWQIKAPSNTVGTVQFSGSAWFSNEMVTVTGGASITAIPYSKGVALRAAPEWFQPGVPFNVTNTILPEAGVGFCIVEETVFAGWSVTNISHGGFLVPALGRLRWGPFTDDQARTLTFTLVPPVTARGTNFFSGWAYFDEEQTTILAAPKIPANSPPTCSATPDQLARSDQPFTTTFAVADDETSSSQLQVTASSSNEALLPSQNLTIVWIGATRCLTVSPQPDMEGETTITLAVSDGTFTIEQSFVLTLRIPPRMTLAPTNQFAQVGGTATFTSLATGSLPLSYQWQLEGVPVSGGGSGTLNLSNIQTNQAGFYRVVVANNVGSVTSVVARLTVNSPPAPGLFLLNTYRNTAKAFSGSKLTRAATDPDADALALISINVATTNGGTVQLSGGQVTYTPPTNYAGADAFDYLLSDGRGGTASGTVTVLVEASSAVSLNRVFGPIVTNGNFVVRFAGLPGYTYTIEYTDSVAPVNWLKATNLIAPTTAGSYGRGVFQFSQSAAGVVIRFYRTVYPAY